MKSIFKNVYWYPEISKWVAKVKVNYKAFHLGCFDNQEEANAAAVAFKARHNMTNENGGIPALVDAFEYRDGVLRAKYSASYIKAGDKVGHECKTHGYVIVGHAGATHMAHHIVWLMFNGPVPSGMAIDHINGRRADNRIENLRVVTKAENARNRALPSSNTSGEIGVKHRPNGKYQVVVGGKYMGTFPSIEEARAARVSASLANGYHPNHGRAAS